jgi:hypothetical protein
MKKLLAYLLCVLFIFQMTSCYRYDFYDDYVSYLQNLMTTETVEGTAIPYFVATEAILEKGKPLSPYYIYDGNYDSDASPLRPSYRQGICRNLKGKPVVVLLFADDEESLWTKEEIISFTNDGVMPALGFLKREAERWGVELDFQVESHSSALTGYNLSYAGVMPTKSKEAIKVKIMEHMAGDLGFNSAWNLYSYMQSQYPTQEIIFLTILNKDGRSYASQLVDVGYNRHVEHCVLYAKSSSAGKYLPQMVAHEILHLFGAEDLYAENATQEIEDITKKEFPNDIMWTYLDHWENQVEAFTAYAIGWTSEIPEVCNLEEWKFD